LPQLVYSPDFNEILIVLPNLAGVLSVTEMEKNLEETKFFILSNWRQRSFLGWTA
jgi:hypothetical protein